MRTLSIACLFAVVAGSAAAQDTQRLTTLTLDEAVSLATKYNPGYLQQINNRKNTSLGIRQAYAAFFPTVSSSMGLSWREGRPTYFEGQQVGAPIDVLSSSYGLSVGVGISYASILQPKVANARLDQSDAFVSSTLQDLRQRVTAQYFTSVEAARNADLQDSLVKGQEVQLRLAQAKEQIGSDISLNTKNAEVNVRRQELLALRAHNDADVQVIRLFEIIGVAAPAQKVTLTTDLPVTEPAFKLDDLLATAKQSNAGLAANRAGESVARLNKQQTRTNYIPSFNINTGINGSTNMPTNATGSDRTWPFGFERSPYGVSLGFSLPIWNGFGRENQIENAQIQLANAQQTLRQAELTLVTNVTSLLSQLQADYRAVQLQKQIVETATLALALAQERYRIGSTPYTDLSLALDRYQQEQNTLLRNTYGYHRTFASLEAAVGRSLR